MNDHIPNPGTEDAINKGCTCPIMDNNHGKFPPWPPDGWWISQGCPVHLWEEETVV